MKYKEVEIKVNVAAGSGAMCKALNELMASRCGMICIRHFKLENNIAYVTLSYLATAYGIKKDINNFVKEWNMK